MFGSSANARRSRRTAVNVILELKLERLMSPVILAQGLFALHTKITRCQGTDGMLKTLACSCKAKDVFPIGIARAVDDHHGGADNLLVVI